jgi:alpha-beta hydrolase superfamily lysophospholipase
VNLPLRTTDVRAAAEDLAGEVEAACERVGSDRLRIVAHSLGGLIARYYVQRMGGDTRVDLLITLGTPHQGSRWAHLVPRRVPAPYLAELRPGSDLLDELAGPAPDCQTRFLAFAAEHDTVVAPTEAAFVRHPDLPARNLVVPRAGHHSLVFARSVTHQSARALATGVLAAGPAAARTPVA